MAKANKDDNFTKADEALEARDYVRFSRALLSEMRRDPIGARDIAEVTLLSLGRSGDDRSPARRILAKAVQVLSTVAPQLSFNAGEKALTL